VLGIFFFAWEWPLGFIAGTAIHRSIEARLVLLPLAALSAALLYQATNPAIYYMVGMGVYFWAYSEGEVGSLATRVLLNKALTKYPDCGRETMESSSACSRRKGLDGSLAFLTFGPDPFGMQQMLPSSATWQHGTTYIQYRTYYSDGDD
jgi:hypothetical protein